MMGDVVDFIFVHKVPFDNGTKLIATTTALLLPTLHSIRVPSLSIKDESFRQKIDHIIIMSFSTSQQVSLSLIPHFTGALSILGSAYVVQDVLKSRERRGKVYHRLLLGMSTCDIINTGFGTFLSTWPIPSDTPNDLVWGAVGTRKSCNFQGFFVQTAISIPAYNASLAIYYMLVIVYNWKDEKMRRVEPLMHVIAIAVGSIFIR